MLHLMLLTAYILINHLDNCARPSKCLNDQGGIIKGPTGTSAEGALPQTTFPIAFNKPLLVLSNMINNSTNPNPNFIDIWTQIRDLQNNSFKMFLQSTGNLYRYDGVYWVAIGL